MQGTSVQRCVGAPPPQACCSRVRRLSAVPGAPTLLTKRVSLRSRVVALQSHKQEDYTSSSTRYYGSPTPRAISSSVQSVSFNQQVSQACTHLSIRLLRLCTSVETSLCDSQLLVVLAVPLAALGVPFILGHPLVCIVLPLIVYSTPGLRAIAAPICTALVQLILSGLRPSGSPRSEAFPWQQVGGAIALTHT